MNEFLLTISTALSMAYMGYSMIRGVPESLSATYYSLGRYGWVFQLFMLSVAFLLLFVWMDVSEEEHRWMVFLSCGSLLFVACAPAFKLKLEGKVHYSAAVVCCVCAVWWQITEGLWDIPLYLGFFAGMLSLQWKDKWCWWLEWAVVGSVLGNLWRLAV